MRSPIAVAGTPIEEAVRDAVLRSIAPPLHPERLWAPLVDACAGGLYFFRILADEIVCIPRPALWLVDGKLHREDGPAVLWPSGERHFFVNGEEVLPPASG